MVREEELRRIIRKYAGSGPRYTSYPTAVELSDDVTAADWYSLLRSELSGDNASSSASLYVHIPFCKSLCYFCACHKVILKERDIVAPYLAALGDELTAYRALLPKISFGQIHWGGGSPSFLTIPESERLFDAITERFSLATEGGDFSIEVDPRTTSEEMLRAYRALGFNRVSFGVQDLDESVQRAVNREQSLETIERLVVASRAEGFSSINVDLIYGLPEQRIETFADTVHSIVRLRPSRIALYGYAHVTWLNKVQRSFERHHLPTPEERLELFLLAGAAFEEAGYRRIGMDHFALPDDSLSRALESGGLHRNFMGYTTHRGATLIGIGASALSSCEGAIVQNAKALDDYMSRVADVGTAVFRGLRRTLDDRCRGSVIDDIFCRSEIRLSSFERRWHSEFWSAFPEVRERLVGFEQDGLLSISDERIALTELGRLFPRNVAMLFDAYLPKHSKRDVFSATV